MSNRTTAARVVRALDAAADCVRRDGASPDLVSALLWVVHHCGESSYAAVRHASARLRQAVTEASG